MEDPIGRPLRKYMLPLNHGYFETYFFCCCCSSVAENHTFALLYRNVMLALWGEFRIILEM